MFLDDKLLKHTLEKEINVPEDVSTLLNELYKICEDHYKPQLHPKMKYVDGTLLMDRTFSSWDLFISRLKKQGKGYEIMADMFAEYSYKKLFLSNGELKRIYELGK